MWLHCIPRPSHGAQPARHEVTPLQNKELQHLRPGGQAHPSCACQPRCRCQRGQGAAGGRGRHLVVGVVLALWPALNEPVVLHRGAGNRCPAHIMVAGMVPCIRAQLAVNGRSCMWQRAFARDMQLHPHDLNHTSSVLTAAIHGHTDRPMPRSRAVQGATRTERCRVSHSTSLKQSLDALLPGHMSARQHMVARTHNARLYSSGANGWQQHHKHCGAHFELVHGLLREALGPECFRL